MALTVISGGVRGGAAILYSGTTRGLRSDLLRRRLVVLPFSSRTLHIASAKKLSPRTGKFDSKKRRTTIATEDGEEQDEGGLLRGPEIETTGPESSVMESASAVAGSTSDDGFVMPELPGDKPDFWEGPQWDAFGFFIQYLWAFGIVFALIAVGIAVSTYNEGATDFKETPAYKESIKSQELLEEPDANSDVFESNPTEVAPSLE